MYRTSWKMVSLALLLAMVLVGGVAAQQQQHQQHHPGGSQSPGEPPAESSSGTPERTQMTQGMMGNMQGMMEHMQSMMGRRGMMAQEEDDESFQRGMMGMGGMIQRHLERVAEQLGLTDEQQAQALALLGNQAKDTIRLKADVEVMAIDLQQLLAADPVDLPKVKQQLQTIASKEADLRFAHITAVQELSKLLTPEQQQKFRAMRGRMMDRGGMMGRGRSQQ